MIRKSVRGQPRTQGGPRKFIETAVLLTTCPQVPLLFWQAWDTKTHGVQQAKPWVSHARTYCQKSGTNTVALLEDSNYGFDVTSSQCRERCEDHDECNFYSHGKWEKGFGPPLGYYGKLRCQLYAKCDFAELPGMSVFEKPDDFAETPPPQNPEFRLLTASMVIFILTMMCVASESAEYLGRNGILGICLVSAFMSFTVIQDVGVKTREPYGIAFAGLIVVHLVNNVGRIALAFTKDPPEPPKTDAKKKDKKDAQPEPEPRANKEKPKRPGGDARPPPANPDDSGDEAKDSNNKKTVVDLTKSRSKGSIDQAEPPTSSMPEMSEDSSTKAAHQRKHGGAKTDATSFDMDLSKVED